MGQIYNILSDHGVQSRTFLCGDMNHCPSLGEQHFPASTIDVWPLLHPNDPGWTENSTVNLMLASKPGKVRARSKILISKPIKIAPVGSF
jgi:hypothetical protein